MEMEDHHQYGIADLRKWKIFASTGTWPRQETLTLLEIKSRLEPKFKEANQKRGRGRKKI
jgi:hypothetical protein